MLTVSNNLVGCLENELKAGQTNSIHQDDRIVESCLLMVFFHLLFLPSSPVMLPVVSMRLGACARQGNILLFPFQLDVKVFRSL